MNIVLFVSGWNDSLELTGVKEIIDQKDGCEPIVLRGKDMCLLQYGSRVLRLVLAACGTSVHRLKQRAVSRKLYLYPQIMVATILCGYLFYGFVRDRPIVQ